MRSCRRRSIDGYEATSSSSPSCTSFMILWRLSSSSSAPRPPNAVGMSSNKNLFGSFACLNRSRTRVALEDNCMVRFVHGCSLSNMAMRPRATSIGARCARLFEASRSRTTSAMLDSNLRDRSERSIQRSCISAESLARTSTSISLNRAWKIPSRYSATFSLCVRIKATTITGFSPSFRPKGGLPQRS